MELHQETISLHSSASYDTHQTHTKKMNLTETRRSASELVESTLKVQDSKIIRGLRILTGHMDQIWSVLLFYRYFGRRNRHFVENLSKEIHYAPSFS